MEHSGVMFVVPPPPGSMTVLLTEEYLSSLITPPPPSQYRSDKKVSGSDVDSDYDSVGGDGPLTPDLIKRTHRAALPRTSPIGASPTPERENHTLHEHTIRTTLPTDTITVRSHPGSATSEHPDSLIERMSSKQDLRQNRMYSSLTRPSTAAARERRTRRGSTDGNLEMPNEEWSERRRGWERDRAYRQPVNQDVHGALDHFIRSEQRYISDINSLLKIHIEPLQYQGCLNIDVVNSIKSSLLRLLHFHQRSCGDFQVLFSKIISDTREGDQPDYSAMIDYMCDALMECRGGFKTYLNFCSMRAQLIRNIAQISETDTTKWEKYTEQCNPSEDPSHSLDAGLAMPVQRIADYPAMIREIQIRGGIRGGVLFEKLGRTCAMLEGVSKAVVERLRMQQEFSCLYKNNRKLEVLIGPIEELLHYGHVCEVKSRDIENFIPDQDTSGPILLVYKKGAALVQRIKIKKKHSFNKLLAGNKEEAYSLKKFYPVSCLQVRDLPHNHVFEISDTVANTRLVLASRELEAKAVLIQNLADIIMDYDKFLSSSLQNKETV